MSISRLGAGALVSMMAFAGPAHAVVLGNSIDLKTPGPGVSTDWTCIDGSIGAGGGAFVAGVDGSCGDGAGVEAGASFTVVDGIADGKFGAEAFAGEVEDGETSFVYGEANLAASLRIDDGAGPPTSMEDDEEEDGDKKTTDKTAKEESPSRETVDKGKERPRPIEEPATFAQQATLRLTIDGDVQAAAGASGFGRLNVDVRSGKSDRQNGSRLIFGLVEFPDPSQDEGGKLASKLEASRCANNPKSAGGFSGDDPVCIDSRLGVEPTPFEPKIDVVYDYAFGFNYGQTFRLFVDLVLQLENGATADLSQTVAYQLILPGGSTLDDPDGVFASAESVSIVPIPPAALLLLSGFGVAAVVRRRAAA